MVKTINLNHIPEQTFRNGKPRAFTCLSVFPGGYTNITHQHRTTISPPVTKLINGRYRTTFITACDAKSGLNKFSENLEAISKFLAPRHKIRAPRRPGARDLGTPALHNHQSLFGAVTELQTTFWKPQRSKHVIPNISATKWTADRNRTVLLGDS